MTAEANRTLFKAATIISVAAILSRLLGYGREMLLAARFGATYTTDAYLVAQDLPWSLFSAVSAGLVMVFIPIYRSVLQREGEERANSLVNTVLNLTLLVAGLLLLLGWALAPGFIPLLVPKLPHSAQVLAISLTRTMLPMLLFMGLGGVAAAVLNANRRFTAPAFVGMVNNLPVVLTLLLVQQTYQIHWVAWAVVAGMPAGALMLLPSMRGLGLRYRLRLNWHDPGLAQVGRLIVPVLVTTSIIQFQDFMDRFLASGLAEGSISALNYAVRLNSLPYGVIGAAIATVLYPSLAEQAADRRTDDLRETLGRGLRSLSFVLLPMALGLLVFRGPIVQLIFERGAFDAAATAATAYALEFYAAGILFFGWQDFLNRCFWALQDTRTPMWAAAVLVLFSLLFKLALVGPLAHGGLALGQTLATLVSVAFLLWRLRDRLTFIGGRELLRSLLFNLGTAAAGALLGYLSYQGLARLFPGDGLVPQVLRLMPGLGIVVIIHAGLALLFGSQEGTEVAARLLGRLRRSQSTAGEGGRAMTEILIAGYYGFHNAGDEALLAGIRRALGQVLPDVAFTAISGTASQTRQLHGIAAVSRSDLSAIWRAIGRADLVMFGGGSLLQDVTSSRSLIYYLGLAVLAKLRGKPVMFCAQGVGPIRRPLGRALVPLVVNRVDRITVRDPEAAETLRQLGVHRPPILVTADAALALGPADPKWGEALLRAEGVDVSRPLIGVSVRPWKQGGGAMEPALARALDRLAQESGAEVVFIPMQQQADAAAARVVAAAMEGSAQVLPGTYTYDQLQAMIARCDLLIGMRYHSLVFAAMNGVPLVGLSYDPKNDAFLKLIGQRAAGSTEGLDPAVVVEAGRRALADGPAVRATLLERMAELEVASRKNAEVVAELLRAGRAAHA